MESIDIERASELLGERRAAGSLDAQEEGGGQEGAPAKKKAAAKKAPAKKTAAKKTAAKKAARQEERRGQECRPRQEGCTDRTVLRCRPGVA